MEFILKSTFFALPSRLFLGSDFIEKGILGSDASLNTKIEKEDIDGFRFGIRWIKGVEFVIGRIYCIDIRSKSGQTIKIRLKSLYGIKKSALSQKYVEIIQTLYDKYFDDISRELIEQVSDGGECHLPKVLISTQGIELKDRKVRIEWDDVETKSYQTYYAIYSKSKPEIYQAFDYLED